MAIAALKEKEDPAPCPFCGSNDAEAFFRTDLGWSIYCRRCGLTTGFRSEERQIIEDWNRRAKE
jgi:Lar family restriction alleviation protein